MPSVVTVTVTRGLQPELPFACAPAVRVSCSRTALASDQRVLRKPHTALSHAPALLASSARVTCSPPLPARPLPQAPPRIKGLGRNEPSPPDLLLVGHEDVAAFPLATRWGEKERKKEGRKEGKKYLRPLQGVR